MEQLDTSGISGDNFRVADDVKSIAIGALMRTQLILMLCRLPKLMRAITVVAFTNYGASSVVG